MRKILSDENHVRYNAYKEFAHEVLKAAVAIVPDEISSEVKKQLLKWTYCFLCLQRRIPLLY